MTKKQKTKKRRGRAPNHGTNPGPDFVAELEARIMAQLGVTPGQRLMVVQPGATSADVAKALCLPTQNGHPSRHHIVAGHPIRFLGAHVDAETLDMLQAEAAVLHAVAQERGERFTYRMAYEEAFRDWVAKHRGKRGRG